MNIEETFDAALREHRAGNLSEAQTFYQRVLEVDPLHADSLHLMGVLAFQAGRLDVAERLIARAIDIRPLADYSGNLGLVLAAGGKWAGAIAAYRRAVALRDDFPQAHSNLGNALRQVNCLDEAIAAYQRAIALSPEFSEAHNNLGLALCEAGALDPAISAFRRAIQIQPNAADARNYLGVALHRKGQVELAIDCWREALSIRSDYPDALNNLGNALKETGRVDEAIAAFRAALALQPSFPEAQNNLGVLLFEKGQAEPAIAAYRNALELRPTFAEPHYNLAIALHETGDTAGAIASCRQAIALRPAWAEACNNLGIWLGESARSAEALVAFDQALHARPDYAEAHSNRGNALLQLGRSTDAIAAYNRAVELHPESAESHNNLGNVLKRTGRLAEAITCFRRALELQPDLAEAYNNLGNVLKDQGDLDEAIACYDRAVSLRPRDAAADSNRIYTLHFHPEYDPLAILAEHQRWNHRHAVAFQSGIAPHANAPVPDRKLRIGYVAPDFRDHCQSLFTMPLLSHHDHDRYAIYCYSDVAAPDEITARLKGHADVWHPIAGMSDARVAAQIRDDQIDILIDLTVHMAFNRLLVFARKPAPVQVTWLGYPGTTGLETMDYRLSDPYLDPPEYDDFYSEQTIRLPDSFWCYDPLTDEPYVNALPAQSNGYVTFGCLNNFCKINDATLRLWAKVLHATPQSRLLLLAPQGAARRRLLDRLAGEGIDAARIEFEERLPRRRYLELYHRIDIGLDTFPYNGHTTSLDSYWMGVPVVTQIGNSAVGRGGFSQLSNLGLADLAADSAENFVKLASTLAGDGERLHQLRGTLRNRLAQSPLMDAPRFAANFENACRWMWKRWVSSNASQAHVSRTADGVRLRIYSANNPRERQAS